MPALKLDKTLLFIFSIGVILLLQMSWVPGFFSDGYLYAAFGKNAALFNNWLVPHLSEETISGFVHHSPFLFILEGLFFKVAGVSYTSARVFASLFTLCSGLVLYTSLKNKKNLAYLSLFFFFILPPILKKTRFPNLDIALMLAIFLSISYYWKAFCYNKRSDWLLCGFFFGISALVKGPMCVWIPAIIIVHLAFEKKLSRLKSLPPWIGFALGPILFSLWPLGLYINGHMSIFTDWVDFTFLITIRDGRNVSSPLWTYLFFLLKNTLPFFLCALYGTYKVLREKESSLMKLYALSFIVIVFSLSCASFKYSNYLIPCYPFMAALAAYPLVSRWGDRVTKIIKHVDVLAVTIAVVLLVFPLTNKIRRNRNIFKAREVMAQFNFKPDNWLVVNHAYSYWPLMSLNFFEDNTETLRVKDLGLDLKKNLKEKSVIVIKKGDLSKIGAHLSGYVNIIYAREGDFYILAPAAYFNFQKPLVF